MEDRPLWAPWRIEYVTAAKTGECIFCVAATGESEQEHLVVQRGTHCFTMLNAFPYASGHVMVSPYRHVGELEELKDEEVADLMHLTRHALGALRGLMSPTGFNVGMNLGEVAGAGFGDHLHHARRAALARRHELHAGDRGSARDLASARRDR